MEFSTISTHSMYAARAEGRVIKAGAYPSPRSDVRDWVWMSCPNSTHDWSRTVGNAGLEVTQILGRG